MADDRLHLDVELDGGDGTIRGTVDDGRGMAVAFTGWLELMSALDNARARTQSSEAARCPDGGDG